MLMMIIMILYQMIIRNGGYNMFIEIITALINCGGYNCYIYDNNTKEMLAFGPIDIAIDYAVSNYKLVSMRVGVDHTRGGETIIFHIKEVVS